MPRPATDPPTDALGPTPQPESAAPPAADGALTEVKEPGPATDAREVTPNYQYWREHGGEWGLEYDQRKLTVPLYHIQELMLTEYIAHHAPAKVLEFGCGPGRHLRNLSRIPGVDVRGYDQSAAMVSGCLRWTGQEWIDRHVTIGMPTGRLPFQDGEFDIVYTAEVLVHVRPEDLPGVLSELVRVARRQVFHLEPDEHVEVISNDHAGCWNHDLVAAYAKLGHDCRILSSGYRAHAPYRVILDAAAPAWEWPPLLVSLYRRMETDLAKGFADLRGEAERRPALEQARRAAEDHLRAVGTQLEQSRAALKEAQTQAASLRDALAAEQNTRRAAETARARADEAADALRRQLESDSARMKDLTARVQAADESVRAAGARVQELERTAEQLRASLARQLRVGREQVTALLAQIETERARASQALSAHQHTLHRLKAIYPER